MSKRAELTRDQIHEAFQSRNGQYANDDAVSACPHWKPGKLLTHQQHQDMLDACVQWIEANEGDY